MYMTCIHTNGLKLKGAKTHMRIKTLLTSALFAKEGEAFAAVALPHTWNALDGQDGGADY